MTTPWYETRHGLVVIAVYGLLTLGAVLLTTGWLVGDAGSPAPNDLPSGIVPVQVYVFAFLGAMAYAFTSVIAKFERGTAGVLRVGLRAVAALPLAAGVFLLADSLGFSATDGQFYVGVAFLVGLYVNVTLRALGGVADRLFGRTGSQDAAPAEPAESGR